MKFEYHGHCDLESEVKVSLTKICIAEVYVITYWRNNTGFQCLGENYNILFFIMFEYAPAYKRDGKRIEGGTSVLGSSI
jgi:hypothetical protein